MASLSPSPDTVNKGCFTHGMQLIGKIDNEIQEDMPKVRYTMRIDQAPDRYSIGSLEALYRRTISWLTLVLESLIHEHGNVHLDTLAAYHADGDGRLLLRHHSQPKRDALTQYGFRTRAE